MQQCVCDSSKCNLISDLILISHLRSNSISNFRSNSPDLNMEVDPVMEAQERERQMMMELQVKSFNFHLTSIDFSLLLL